MSETQKIKYIDYLVKFCLALVPVLAGIVGFVFSKLTVTEQKVAVLETKIDDVKEIKQDLKDAKTKLDDLYIKFSNLEGYLSNDNNRRK